jgi:phosphoglycerate dehydrogenase-like enzyme
LSSGHHVVFTEDDTLFRLMEMALRRQATEEGLGALRYFYGAATNAPLATLLSMADRLDLPRGITATVCRDETALETALAGADAVVVETTPLPEPLVAACGRARLIQQFGRVCGHIALPAARQAGIPVANLVRLASLSCAEHTTALVLALARRLLPAHAAVQARHDPASPPPPADTPLRNRFNWAGLSGFRLLARSTIGFIGMGETAGFVAPRLSAMGMRVLYHKRQPLGSAEEQALGGITHTALPALLAESDFVTLHLPHHAGTEKCVDAAFLRAMKPGAFLINTARGGLVDERALFEAIRSGHLAGAALDVYRTEPVPPAAPLLGLPEVIWTPHIGGGEPDYMIADSGSVLANIARAWRGGTPEGLMTT